MGWGTISINTILTIQGISISCCRENLHTKMSLRPTLSNTNPSPQPIDKCIIYGEQKEY